MQTQGTVCSVDNILLFYPKTIFPASNISNSLYSNILFSIEIESHNCLPFLNVLVYQIIHLIVNQLTLANSV